MIVPILAIALIAMFAGRAAKKKPPTRTRDPEITPEPEVTPVVEEYYDPTDVVLEYGEFTDDQGVREALMILGFGYPTVQQNIARFQDYGRTYFDLDEGVLRFDGTLDNQTLQYLAQAMADFEEGEWVSEEEYTLDQALKDFEYDNSVGIVEAWPQEPLLAWELADGDVMFPMESGQSVSSWLASAVYWGTYNVGGQDEPGASMPKTFWPVPYTQQWEAEADARATWSRIHEYVKLLMEESGVPDDTVYPEPNA